jgi:hypothetical protein
MLVFNGRFLDDHVLPKVRPLNELTRDGRLNDLQVHNSSIPAPRSLLV